MGLFSDWRFEVYTPIRDPFGPIKYEPPELIRVIAVLPELAGRLEAVEDHLASGGKQPFIRSADRLSGEAIAQMQRAFEGMTKRLEAVEQRLAQNK